MWCMWIGFRSGRGGGSGPRGVPPPARGTTCQAPATEGPVPSGLVGLDSMSSPSHPCRSPGVGGCGSTEGVRMVNWWVRRRTSAAVTDRRRPGCRRPGRRGEKAAAKQKLGSRVYSENWRTGEIESNPTFTRACTYTSPNSNWHTHTRPQLTPKGSNEIKIVSTPKSLSPSRDLQLQLLSRFLLPQWRS
jgi:hypothetical protein